MDEQKVKDLATRIKADAESILAELSPPPSEWITVKAGQDLQKALDVGGAVLLEDGATFEGGYKVSVPGTRLVGPKSFIKGPKGMAALYIPPGANDIQVNLGDVQSASDQTVVLCGDNDSKQTKPEDAPFNIQLTIFVPTFRGKRAFYINSKDTLLENCGALDIISTAGLDCQGVLIANSPGNVTVRGGKFEAVSENILVGGTGTAIVNLYPTNLLFENLDLSKPLDWMTAGYPVKNNFELKSGVNVTLRNSKMDGNWVKGQSGHSIVITPRDNKKISNVLIEDVVVTNVGNVLNMLAYDDGKPSPQLDGVTLRRVNGTTRSGAFGDGRFAMWSGGGKNITIENCIGNQPNTIIYSYQGKVWNPDGTAGTKTYETMNVRISDNDFLCNGYGVMTPEAYGKNWKTCFPDGAIENNKFHGTTATKMKANLPPSNTYSA